MAKHTEVKPQLLTDAQLNDSVSIIDLLATLRNDRIKNKRLFDLVRYARHYLHDKELITDQEFTELVVADDHATDSVSRLKSYDDVRHYLTLALAREKRCSDLISKIQKIVEEVLGPGTRSQEFDILDQSVREAINKSRLEGAGLQGNS